MQITDEMIIDCRRMVTGQVQSAENGVGLTMLDPTDGSQAVALDQHRHCIQENVATGSQRFKESPFVETKSLFTGNK